MGNRITKVYTRTGDDGSTGKADGSRIQKSDPLIQAIGEIDEFNANIGLLRSERLPADIDQILLAAQNDLFAIGGELTMPEFRVIEQAHIEQLEKYIDQFNETLEPLKEFILPAGNRVIALCHVARTACRRTERSLVILMEQTTVRDELLQYLNRLSDVLFVLARVMAKHAGLNETYWKNDSVPKSSE